MIGRKAPLAHRIIALTLEGFKGFRAARTIDLDADIVLLSGPNGYGKTSVIEALEVLFTGGWVDRRATRATRGADWDPLINSEHTGQAVLRAQVELADAGRMDVVAQLPPGGGSLPTTFQALAAEHGQQLDLEDNAFRDLLRDSCFYYQDGHNAFLRLAQAAQGQVIQHLVPEPPFFDALRVGAAQVASTAKARLSALVRGPSVEEIDRGCAAAAASLQRALAQCPNEIQVRLVKRDGGLYARTTIRDSVRAAGQKVAAASQTAQSITDDRRTWAPGLEAIAQRGRELADDARSAPVTERAPEQPPAALLRLPPDAASPLALRNRLKELGPRDALERARDAATERTDELESLHDLLLNVVESREERIAPGWQVGVLPLLRSALALADEGSARLGQLSRAHAAVGRVIGSILSSVSADELRSALEAAEKLLQDTSDAIACVRQELAEAQGPLADVEALQEAERAYEEIETWLRNTRHKTLADFASREHPDKLDAVALRREADGQALSPPAHDPVAAWEEVARAAADWAMHERELERASRKAEREGPARLTALAGLAGRLSSTEFATDVRARLLEQRHQSAVDTAVRRVLSRFALHYHIRHNLEVRLNAKRGISIVLPGRREGSAERDERSLSTGQYNALCVALSVVFSLNRTDNPLGFVCLDDVSSAFDLDNLACDAAVIRALAYGEDEATRRQVILATHHDELTTRLMPLLRPPKDRSLNVIEFTDWSSSHGPEIREWSCIGGRSGAREVLKLWDVRHRQELAAVGRG